MSDENDFLKRLKKHSQQKWVCNFIYKSNYFKSNYEHEYEFDSYHEAEHFMRIMFNYSINGDEQKKEIIFKLFKKDNDRNDNAYHDKQDSEACREDE